MKKLTKMDAISVLIDEAYKARNSYAGYKRVRRACLALNLSHDEWLAILRRLEYVDSQGAPFRWLADAICADGRSHAYMVTRS